MFGPLRPSDKLGTFPIWDWIIDSSPGRGFLIMLVISPIIIKYGLRPFIEGRILTRKDEFMSFHFDMFLALALGCGLVLVNALDNRVYARQSTWVDWLFLAFSIGFGVMHLASERKFYSLRQLLSPSKIYHELLFPFMGYALLTVCLFGMIYAPWSFDLIIIRVVMLAAVATWASAWPMFDEKRRLVRNDLGMNLYELAHTAESWPWQHRYLGFDAWWRRYVADWKRGPGRLWLLGSRIFNL